CVQMGTFGIAKCDQKSGLEPVVFRLHQNHALTICFRAHFNPKTGFATYSSARTDMNRFERFACPQIRLPFQGAFLGETTLPSTVIRTLFSKIRTVPLSLTCMLSARICVLPLRMSTGLSVVICPLLRFTSAECITARK